MTGFLVLALYVGAFFGSFYLARILFKSAFEKKGFNKLKTVTFGDESAITCLLYTSPSPRDLSTSRMPSSA